MFIQFDIKTKKIFREIQLKDYFIINYVEQALFRVSKSLNALLILFWKSENYPFGRFRSSHSKAITTFFVKLGNFYNLLLFHDLCVHFSRFCFPNLRHFFHLIRVILYTFRSINIIFEDLNMLLMMMIV